MTKKHDAETSLAALQKLNDEISRATISDKAIRGWAQRLDAIVRNCRDFTERWMKRLPARCSPELEAFEVEWATMSLELQNVYTEGYTAAHTPSDFLKLDVTVWNEPLQAAGKALLDLMSLPMALKTSRVQPARVERQSEYAPSVRAALLEAAAKPETKPEGSE